MSRYKRFGFIIIVAELMVILLCNGLYFWGSEKNTGRLYRVEAARVVEQLREKTLSELDLSEYETIIKVSEFRSEENSNNDYVVESVGGSLYRIEYGQTENQSILFYMNIAFGFLLLLTVFLLIYIGKKVLQPFHNMSELSFELAKGNLSIPIKEEKSKFFGRFLWGMDMLRENLESSKEKELEYQKEKKTLILSLSHDIKTPLSAIGLYTRALSEGLYDTEEKQKEALLGISKNAKEIEEYVNKIVTASREDFLNLEVNLKEFYLSEVMKSIELFYKDKLQTLHTELIMEETTDCLLKGDSNRLVEVLQNIMENAIKYGDGKQIKISYDEEEDCRLILVENTGCSLKEEELPNVFDSFYRGSNSHRIKGSGLGLYICRELMKKMDGEIYAKKMGDSFLVVVVTRKA